MSLLNEAWEILFDRYNILHEVNNKGFFEIGAKTIKTVREPRLMAKFDHKTNLPKIFRKNDISILPISRSSYVLGKFDAYKKVKYNEDIKPIEMSLPNDITSIDPFDLYSESATLHCAYASGMISDLLGEECIQTVSGRMSSQTFDFNIRTYLGTNRQVSIKNAQVEIDGGYESESQFAIIEAKKEAVDDFLVRQLYYPYRLWQGKIKKQVKPIFFTHSADKFSFFVYEFEDPFQYNSLQLIEQKNYIIAHEEITLDDIIEIIHGVELVSEPRIPFPQADTFTRILDLMGLLVERNYSKDELSTTTSFDFTNRQTEYYTSAARYLGFIEKYTDNENSLLPTTRYTLTKKGNHIMKLPYKRKYIAIVSSILEHRVFNQVLREYLDNGYQPQRSRVIEIMKQANLYNVDSEKTYHRRASTVLKWIDWILELQND
jgi:hypothetical protein